MAPEETVADFDIRSPASRTLLTVVGTIVVIALVVGALLGLSHLMRDTKVVTSVVELGTSAQLKINATSADIRVVQGGEGVVTVTARVTRGLLKTDYALGRRGDEIKVVSRCQTWLSPGCGVSMTIAVPKGLPVEIDTTSGDIEARSTAEGVLTVASTSGDIDARMLTVDEFSATSGSGNIRATFAAQPFAFKANTKAGDITADIPTGKRTYNVLARSKSGHVSSAITVDKSGQGFVRVLSDSGDIRLTTR